MPRPGDGIPGLGLGLRPQLCNFMAQGEYFEETTFDGNG